MGDGTRTEALGRSRSRTSHRPGDRRGGGARRRRHDDPVRVLVGQLEASDPGSDGAHAPLPERAARRGEAVSREWRAAHHPRAPRSSALVTATHDRAGGIADRFGLADASARRGGLFGTRRAPPRGGGDAGRAGVTRAVLGAAGAGGSRPAARHRGGSRHPHRRRAAPQRLPALGVRVRGAALCAQDVARVHGGRSRRRAGRLPRAESAVWGGGGGGGGGVGGWGGFGGGGGRGGGGGGGGGV